MSNIKSHYIDFRSEHRIYLLDGMLHELVGMFADIDYDEWNENVQSSDPSPVARYKLVFNSEYMFDGGRYKEGELPNIFAHRGDGLEVSQVMALLLHNMIYNIDSAVVCLEDDLMQFGLCCKSSLCDIVIRLCPVWSGFRVETDMGGALMFINTLTDGKISLTVDGYEKCFTYRELAISIGEILYALREYFKRDIEIVKICRVENECKADQREVITPTYEKFRRIIELGALKEEKYWEKKDNDIKHKGL